MRAMERIGLLMQELKRVEAAQFPDPVPAGRFSAPRPKLPVIDLTKFSGDILKWESFRDQFSSLVHNCPYLDPIQKFVHLQRSLDGEAAEVIRNTPPTGEAYQDAWNALVIRYGNRRILSMMHMKSLVDLKPAASSSPTEIKRVLDFVQQTVRSFRTMGKPAQEWNEWMVFFLTIKLDPQTKVDWETSLRASSAVPEFQTLVDFLKNRLQALQISSHNIFMPTFEQQQLQPNNGAIPKKPRTAAGATSRSHPNKCPFCAQHHQAYGCPKYLEVTVSARWDMVRSKKLCQNCLGSGHFRSKCPSSGRCRTCSSGHHSSLHQDREQSNRDQLRQERAAHAVTNTVQAAPQAPQQEAGQSVVPQNTHSVVSLAVASNTVLLATAIIRIVGLAGKSIQARAFLDPRADTSFVSQAVVQAVSIVPQRVDAAVWGFSSSRPLQIRHQAQAKIANLDGNFETCITALVKHRIDLRIPSTPVEVQYWPHIQGLRLTDPGCMTPSRIDVLLGADIWNRVFLDERRQGPPGTPDAYVTQFGFVLLGPASPSTGTVAVNTITSHQTADLCAELRRFWEIEEVSHSRSSLRRINFVKSTSKILTPETQQVAT